MSRWDKDRALASFRADPDVSVLLVTGGPAVVAEALRTPKKAITAGPGNPPAVVDQTADVEQAGAGAFPIVSLISFLIGMIFAFVGVMQLQMFGAGIFTANLVALAMVREMAPIMTAIIMAGRTGASYAAQIGTMKVNEEVDALTTLGINPIDFLVAPRVIALVLMLPLLSSPACISWVPAGR